MRVELRRSVLRFAEPITTSYGELRTRELLLLTLTGADGVRGRGEAAPLEPYDGVPLEHVHAALEAYRPLLISGDGSSGGELLEACRTRADLPQALAAVDVALWDLAGRRAGRPVCELLADDPAEEIEVSATVSARSSRAAADAASAAVCAGYRCVKLKVGIGDDAGRVAAVRAAIGSDVDLRLDANGSWSVEEAIRIISELEAQKLELVEEPVHGVEAMRAVRAQVATRLAVDETASIPGASAAADAVCLKVASCGGISALLAAAELARSAGTEVYLGSSFDGPVGIAAALHAAAALAPLPRCGLATLELLERPDHRLRVHGGAIAVPQGPGLGL